MSAAKPFRTVRISRKKMIMFGAAGLAVAGALAFYFRDDIAFGARLLYATFVANRFYANSSGITKNIAYGPHDREKLDVYQPNTPGPHPVLIWVYGGSWSSGNKELYASVAQRLLSHNFVVVIPDYTLYSENQRQASAENPIAFEQAREIANVFAWTRSTISQFGGDPDQIVWGGQSAGAQLTGLVTFDPQYLGTLGHTAQELCGWYGIAGPYDLNAQLAYERNVKHNQGELLFAVFGNKENMTAASPRTHARADAPMTLLIHGDADETVPLEIGVNFQAALETAGARSEFKIYPGAGHAGLLFDALAQDKPRLVQDLVDFVARCKQK